jgi:hypothetical protein
MIVTLLSFEDILYFLFFHVIYVFRLILATACALLELLFFLPNTVLQNLSE